MRFRIWRTGRLTQDNRNWKAPGPPKGQGRPGTTAPGPPASGDQRQARKADPCCELCVTKISRCTLLHGDPGNEGARRAVIGQFWTAHSTGKAGSERSENAGGKRRNFGNATVEKRETTGQCLPVCRMTANPIQSNPAIPRHDLVPSFLWFSGHKPALESVRRCALRITTNTKSISKRKQFHSHFCQVTKTSQCDSLHYWH